MPIRVQLNVPALAAEGKAAFRESIPQGLKPLEVFSAAGGTAEAVPFQNNAGPSQTERSHALALQLLHRYGVLLRESVAAENVPGGFSAVYDVLKALEESGRIRRGYFVGGLGATQFALPAAVDLLRQLRTEPPPEKPEFVQLAATDPANPYGSILRWPELPVAEEDSETAPRVLDARSVRGSDSAQRPAGGVAQARQSQPVGVFARRGTGALAIGGRAGAFPVRARPARMRNPDSERMRTPSHEGVLITTINGQPVGAHFMARFLMDAGFHPGPLGMHLRRILLPVAHSATGTAEVQ